MSFFYSHFYKHFIFLHNSLSKRELLSFPIIKTMERWSCMTDSLSIFCSIFSLNFFCTLKNPIHPICFSLLIHIEKFLRRFNWKGNRIRLLCMTRQLRCSQKENKRKWYGNSNRYFTFILSLFMSIRDVL